jgi:hypothetical protein
MPRPPDCLSRPQGPFCETTFSWPILNLRRRRPIHFLKPAKARTTGRGSRSDARPDFASAEFRDMKMQPSLERALRHKEMLKA